MTNCSISLYADDTALYFSAKNTVQIENVLNNEIALVSEWFGRNKLTLNTKKTKVMLFGTPYKVKHANPVEIKVNNETIEQVHEFKYLGVILDSSLKFAKHTDYITRKVNAKIAALGRVRNYLPNVLMLTLYKSLIRPHFDYCDIVWGCCPKYLQDRLQILQNRALRIINKMDRYTSIDDLHNMSHIPTLKERRKIHLQIFMYKVFHNLAPNTITSKFKRTNDAYSHSTRAAASNSFCIPSIDKDYGKNSLSYRGAICWNSISPENRKLPSLPQFKRAAK